MICTFVILSTLLNETFGLILKSKYALKTIFQSDSIKLLARTILKTPSVKKEDTDLNHASKGSIYPKFKTLNSLKL